MTWRLELYKRFGVSSKKHHDKSVSKDTQQAHKYDVMRKFSVSVYKVAQTDKHNINGFQQTFVWNIAVRRLRIATEGDTHVI